MRGEVPNGETCDICWLDVSGWTPLYVRSRTEKVVEVNYSRPLETRVAWASKRCVDFGEGRIDYGIPTHLRVRAVVRMGVGNGGWLWNRARAVGHEGRI